jgi:NitT/TauT family transport system substrate-binding protein
MKFKFLLLATLSSLTLLGSACSVQRAEAPDPTVLTKIDVCFSGDSGTQAVVWYAFEKGLFKKYGLDVKLVSITGGSQAATAMITGEMDFCQIAGSAVVNAVVAGEDLVIIGGLFNTYATSFMVRPEIKTATDLRGKAVAISKPGSASDTEIRVALKELNLQPDKEVAVLAVGGQGERMAAMESGQVAGTVFSPPNTLEGREKGYRELLDLSKLNLPFQHTSLVTTRPYLAENPEVAQAFMQATIEAIARMKQDPSGTKAVMAKYLLLDEENDADALNEAYTVLIQKTLSEVPYPTLEGIQAILTELKTENSTAAKVKPEDVADLSLVQTLEDSGFIDQVSKP